MSDEARLAALFNNNPSHWLGNHRLTTDEIGLIRDTLQAAHERKMHTPIVRDEQIQVLRSEYQSHHTGAREILEAAHGRITIMHPDPLTLDDLIQMNATRPERIKAMR